MRAAWAMMSGAPNRAMAKTKTRMAPLMMAGVMIGIVIR